MNKYDIPDIVHSGVLYNQYAKQIYDQRTSDAKMKMWYSSHLIYFSLNCLLL